MQRPVLFRPQQRLRARLCISAVCVVLLAACVSAPDPVCRRQIQAAALRELLLQLDSGINPDEAERLARAAVERSAELAVQYRAVKPPWLHNWLVNAGRRERGLCYDWANDLLPNLQAVGLHSLELHLAVARMDTRREHNCIIVTARAQSIEQGLVFDAWRHSGRLWFGWAAGDRYPWQPLPRDRVAPELQRFWPEE